MTPTESLDVAPPPTAPLRTGVEWVDRQLADFDGDASKCVECGGAAEVVEIVTTHEVGERDLWATPVCGACVRRVG